MDRELAGGDVGGDEHQRDGEDDGSEADKKVGEDQLVAQAPEHATAYLPPEDRDGEHGESDATEDLKHA